MIFTVALCCGLSVSAFAVEYNLNSFNGYYQTPATGGINFSAGNFPLSLSGTTSYTSSGSGARIYWVLKASSLPEDVTYYFKLYFPVSSATSGVKTFEINFYGGDSSDYTTLVYDYASNVLTFNEIGSDNNAYAFRDFSYAPIYSGETIVGVSFSGVKNSNIFEPIIGSYFYFKSGFNTFKSAFQSYDDFIVSTEPIVDEPVYNPTITATTSNVTDTTVDLAIDVTGMNPAKTYNIRIDGTTADGEDLSQVIGTITGEETYSTSATLGPFTPNTTYRATLVLVENGVDVSSDSIEYTTLPYMYSYNGYLAPASPITNEQRNPVQLMYEYDGDVYLASSGRAFILSGNNIIFRRDSLASSNVIYKLNGTIWELYNSDPAPLTALLGDADGFIWSNTDVLSNSGLYFADTSIQTHYPARYYSFNGTVLPWPNELDRSFRYDVLWKIGGSYYWMASDSNYTIREAVMYTGEDSTISVLFKYNGDKWEWQETFPAGDNVCSGGFAGFIWSNHDIRNERGIYFAGSDQVEVEGPDADRDYLPSLTVNVNSVDSSSAMFDVTVYDADPEATYTIEWSVYRAGTQVDTGVGSSIMEGGTSYKGQWALSGLASGTTYSTLFELYADGESTGVMQSVSFTTNVGSSTEQPDITETPTGGYESDKDYGPLLTLMLNELYHLRYDIVPDLKSIVQTLANPAEDKVAVNNEPLLNEINNVLYNEAGNGNALTVSDIGDLADIQGVFKGIFSGDYGFSDFLDLFSDDSFGSWFSSDTAMNLNPTAYGSPSAADLDDPYNMQAYYDNMEKVRNKAND